MNVAVWDPDFSECFKDESSKMKKIKEWGQLIKDVKTWWEANIEGRGVKPKNLSQKHLWNDYALSYQQILFSNLYIGPFKVDHIAG